MARSIDYYFSLQSPWAYIGNGPFGEIARRHAARIVYKPVLLGEVFAETGGLPLAKRHPARQDYRLVELQRWRVKRGLAFHIWPQHWPFDADLANCAALAIVAAGADPAGFLQAAFNAVWEDELNLADLDVLRRLLSGQGLDADAIIVAAQSDDIRAAYERNRQEAIGAGVFGSPAYVLDGEVFWGQDRLELLEDALASGRAPFTAKTGDAVRHHI